MDARMRLCVATPPRRKREEEKNNGESIEFSKLAIVF